MRFCFLVVHPNLILSLAQYFTDAHNNSKIVNKRGRVQSVKKLISLADAMLSRATNMEAGFIFKAYQYIVIIMSNLKYNI